VRLVIFGATGGTGRLLVEQALSAGHDVTAFARPGSTIEARPRLSIVIGSVLDSAAVASVIAEQDAVLCALGGRPWRNSRICSSALRRIIPGMKQHGIRRILAISSLGAGDTRGDVGWFARNVLFRVLLRTEIADKEAMEDLLLASGLDWTVVRVGLLTDGSLCGELRVADDHSIQGMGRIARSDVATFMLAQIGSEFWKCRRPVLVY
jgi:putative NADH-flavin reductase